METDESNGFLGRHETEGFLMRFDADANNFVLEVIMHACFMFTVYSYPVVDVHLLIGFF